MLLAHAHDLGPDLWCQIVGRQDAWVGYRERVASVQIEVELDNTLLRIERILAEVNSESPVYYVNPSREKRYDAFSFNETA
ncbi:MAG: hypothetical protein ACYSU0_02290 [Planctomycetota bacterium]